MAALVVRPRRSPKDLAQTSPALLGFRAAADAHFVGPLGRCTTSTFATLRVDRLTARETELPLAQTRNGRNFDTLADCVPGVLWLENKHVGKLPGFCACLICVGSQPR